MTNAISSERHTLAPNVQLFMTHQRTYQTFSVTTKVARLETTKTRSHNGTKKRKSFEMLGVLSVFAPLW
jgi:hypothetical protein